MFKDAIKNLKLQICKLVFMKLTAEGEKEDIKIKIAQITLFNSVL